MPLSSTHTDACTIVGCQGMIYDLGAVATGAAYHVLVDEVDLLEDVTDPIATPFRLRWHSMVTFGPNPLPAPDDDNRMVVWPGRAG